MNRRIGITGAGNWIIDYAKIIDNYPAQDTLATIISVSTSTGGAAYNLLMDLAFMGVPFPLSGIGLVGNDTTGKHILNDCRNQGINNQQLRQIKEAGTSYTDVMIARETGRRTFFTYRGANAFLGPEHFDFTIIHSKIMHLGYPLLLDTLDAFHDNQNTNASLVLKKAQREGIITSLDLVSENSDRFLRIITPSLPFVDILFLNEFEASQLTGIDITGEQTDKKNVQEVIIKLFKMGVNRWVILHFPKGVIATARDGGLFTQGSVKLPNQMIKGTPGAGDALAAGILYGIHEDWPMQENLIAGVCTAAASLTEKGCSEGVRQLKDCLALGSEYGYRKMP